MPRAARTALITGSNKNIGRACALALAKGGFNIVVNGAKDRAAAEAVAREVETLGVEALVAMGDVGKREDSACIAKEALERFGTVDALLNNAAMRPDGKFLEMSEADFDRVVDTDYKAAYWLARATIPGRRSRSARSESKKPAKRGARPAAAPKKPTVGGMPASEAMNTVISTPSAGA